MARQLRLDLPPPQGPGQAEFLVAPSNAAAHAAVTGDAPWPQGKLWLYGPEGAGKSHLVRLWAATRGAGILDAATLPAALPPPGAEIAVENVDTLPPSGEEPLFHLHNHLAATGGRLLLTARVAPSRLRIALPDLASRLQATHPARIEDPDDHLLALLLARLFADRHILPPAGVIPYLAARIERSHRAAQDIVAALDQAALAEGRGITLALARAVLDKDTGPAR